MEQVTHCDEITTELQVGSVSQLTTENNFINSIERLATNPNVDPDKLEKFMNLQERILDRNAEQAFNADMVKCQAEIRTVKTNRKNDQTHSRYADHEAISKAVTPIYTRHGFALSFYEGDTPKEKHVRVMVDVMHRDGHSKTRFKDFPIDDVGIKGTVNKTQIHANQSAFTYGKRNLTCMIFNIPTGEDDDGNHAGGVQYINTDQQTEIDDLVKLVYDPEPERFWNYMKVESSDKILSRDYNKAITALRAAEKAKKAKVQK